MTRWPKTGRQFTGVRGPAQRAKCENCRCPAKNPPALGRGMSIIYHLGWPLLNNGGHYWNAAVRNGEKNADACVGGRGASSANPWKSPYLSEFSVSSPHSGRPADRLCRLRRERGGAPGGGAGPPRRRRRPRAPPPPGG